MLNGCIRSPTSHEKKETIALLNAKIGSNALSSANTHWSNVVNYMNGQGWWLNIRFHKFSQDLHLVLNDEKAGHLFHIQIPANSITKPAHIFRDKKGEADIFIPHDSPDNLIDTQSGSARHNFSDYRITVINYR